MTPAEQHAYDAGRFAELTTQASEADWAASTPVPEWRAIDVVKHLVEWLPGFLERTDLTLPPVDVDDDPVAAWTQRSADVQRLIEEHGDRPFDSPMPQVDTVGTAVNQFYTNDIWMHSWDLGEALGVGFDLGDERAAAALAGMEPLDAMLRDSGQFGPRVEVADDAPVQDRFMAFIGRDPRWR